MSSELHTVLTKLERQCEVLGIARNDYLSKESERKHFEAKLIKEARGKSHAERVTEAQSLDLWLEFHKKLARLEAIYEFQKLKFEVLSKEYQAIYLELKIEHQVIQKQ